MMYTLKSLSGDEKLQVKRVGADKLEISMGDKKMTAFTEDLAALVREELPKDRAQELFSEIETRTVQKGKARVAVIARENVKKGDQIRFTIDVAKYVDKYNNPVGLRTLPNGFLLT